MSETAANIIFGLENPLLDISAVVPADMLTKYELTENLAILAEEKHLPIYNELVDNYDVEFIAGGATQNSIRVAQWMLKTPGATCYMGCVGKDKFGDILEESARKNGVNVRYLRDEVTPTGTCAVLVTGKQRTLVANVSAAAKYQVSHLEDPVNWSHVTSAKLIYISAFFIPSCVPALMKVAEHAAAENKIFCMNLAAPFVSQFFTAPLLKALEYCDVIFGNETEAEAFAASQSLETKDLRAIALHMAALPKANTTRPRMVVITHGAEPTIIAYNDQVSEFAVERIPDSEIVDTNGAGDAFVGGFISRLVHDKPTEECVKAGCWAAGQIIRRSGCTFPDVCEYAN